MFPLDYGPCLSEHHQVRLFPLVAHNVCSETCNWIVRFLFEIQINLPLCCIGFSLFPNFCYMCAITLLPKNSLRHEMLSNDRRVEIILYTAMGGWKVVIAYIVYSKYTNSYCL